MTARPRRATPGDPRPPQTGNHDREHGHGHDRGDGHARGGGHDHRHGAGHCHGGGHGHGGGQGHGGGASPGAAWERDGVFLELVQADLLSYVPAQEGFDLVVVANVHLAPDDRGPFLARAVAAVSPGGHLFVSGHHLDSFGRAGPPFPERLYTEELLAGLLSPLAAQVRRHVRPPGEAGSSPLVDVVAWARAPGGSGGGR